MLARAWLLVRSRRSNVLKDGQRAGQQQILGKLLPCDSQETRLARLGYGARRGCLLPRMAAVPARVSTEDPLTYIASRHMTLSQIFAS